MWHFLQLLLCDTKTQKDWSLSTRQEDGKTASSWSCPASQELQKSVTYVFQALVPLTRPLREISLGGTISKNNSQRPAQVPRTSAYYTDWVALGNDHKLQTLPIDQPSQGWNHQARLGKHMRVGPSTEALLGRTYSKEERHGRECVIWMLNDTKCGRQYSKDVSQECCSVISSNSNLGTA